MNIKEREELLEKYKAKLEVAEQDQTEEKEELREIVSALIKTIPEEPISNTCPWCGRLFFIKTNFCSDCGQAMR